MKVVVRKQGRRVTDTDGQKDKQTDRQKDRETDRQTGKKGNRQEGRQEGKQVSCCKPDVDIEWNELGRGSRRKEDVREERTRSWKARRTNG